MLVRISYGVIDEYCVENMGGFIGMEFNWCRYKMNYIPRSDLLRVKIKEAATRKKNLYFSGLIYGYVTVCMI